MGFRSQIYVFLNQAYYSISATSGTNRQKSLKNGKSLRVINCQIARSSN